VRTFRISQFIGVNGSIGSIDLAARADAILATARQIFIGFRELLSARGNALLQLSKPVQNHVDGGRACRRGRIHRKQPDASSVRSDVEIAFVDRTEWHAV
jgi:hypothetical protein